MKKFITLLIWLPLCSMAQQKRFVINGFLPDIKNRSLICLTDANKPADTLAKTRAVNGKFVLKGRVPEPGLYNLNISSPRKEGLLFLDNSNVFITGNARSKQKLKVNGSASHKDFEAFQRTFVPLFDTLNRLSMQIKNTGMTEDLSARAAKATKKIQDKVDVFIRQKKASYVSPFLIVITAQLSDDPQLLETRYSVLTEKVQQGNYGREVKNFLDNVKVGAVGSAAIDFTQNDPEGKPVSLSSFKGKYVLVDFWASWCGPCRQENPNVVNNYLAFKDKNFTVLGVSLDRTKDPWVKAIQDDNLTWTHVSDLKFWNNEVAQKYRIQSIPQNFLIDPQGKIIARNLRGPELSNRLTELLK